MSDGYEVVLSAEAMKTIRRLPKQLQRVVITAFGVLEQNPHAGKPLAGELTGVWSLRRGDYRLLYRIDDRARLVEIARVGHRGEVYRRRS